MKIWHKTSPVIKALIISCLLHGLFAVLLFWQSDQITPEPERAELYEMDLTQPLSSETELPVNTESDLTSEPNPIAKTEKKSQGESPKPAITTPPQNQTALVRSKPTAPVVIKRNIQIPTILKTVEPLYPTKIAQEKQPFKLTLMVEILDSGQPGMVAVAQSSGSSELDDAAIAAIKQCVFAPAIDLTAGKTVPFFATIDLTYPPLTNNATPQKQGMTP